MNNSDLLSTDFNTLNEAQLDEIVERTTEIIRKSCFASMKLRGNYQRKYNPWWTSELESMKKEVLRIHRQLHTRRKNKSEPIGNSNLSSSNLSQLSLTIYAKLT